MLSLANQMLAAWRSFSINSASVIFIWMCLGMERSNHIDCKAHNGTTLDVLAPRSAWFGHRDSQRPMTRLGAAHAIDAWSRNCKPCASLMNTSARSARVRLGNSDIHI
jgi:hypothetical protein